MRVSILSSRDTVSKIVFTLSFNVTFGPPSRVLCYRNNHQVAFFNQRNDPNLSREVIRSQYVSSSQPDITRVSVKLEQQRVEEMYRCGVTVEGRTGIASGTYAHDPKSFKTTNQITVTGE